MKLTLEKLLENPWRQTGKRCHAQTTEPGAMAFQCRQPIYTKSDKFCYYCQKKHEGLISGKYPINVRLDEL